MSTKKILSTLLAFAIALSCIGWVPTRAEQADAPALDNTAAATQVETPDDSEAHIARLRDEEGSDLNRQIYLNADGSRTMYIYDHPVKYVDESGTIRDISLQIADGSTAQTRFLTAANSAVTSFPANLFDGIRLAQDDVSIELLPIPSQISAEPLTAAGTASRLDSETISYTYDTNTTVEYSLTYTGFKEDIVVSSYTGQTEYTFLLKTNGLTLTQIDESYYLTDESGAIRATIGDIIVFTADERNNTMGRLEARTVQANQRYMLTIVLDADYLSDPDTAYPIRIDPTIELNADSGSGAIEDVTIYSNVTPDGSSTSLFVGLRETRGISRTLMRFPGLDLSGLRDATITSATVTLRDLMCQGTNLEVSCYAYTGASWTESTATWAANASGYGALLDTQVISYNNGYALSPKHRYNFDITALVDGWIHGTYSENKGILFKASDTLETGTTLDHRQFGSYNRTSYQPTLTIDYVPFYTIYASGNTSSTYDIGEGGTLQLYANSGELVLSDLTWQSDNTAVATISSSGLVTAQKAGTAVISAYSASLGMTAYKTIYVTIADGMYYIGNASSGLCMQGASGQCSINAKTTNQSTRIDQLWKIAYVGSGKYVIRPIRDLSKALTVNSSGYAAVAAAATADTGTTTAFRWTIGYGTNGYAIAQNGGASKALIPTVSGMPGSAIYAGTPTSDAASRWTLERAYGAFLRDISSSLLINESNSYDVEIDSRKTLAQLGIQTEIYATSSSQAWSTGNATVSTVVSGTVYGKAIGSTLITYSVTINGVIYQSKYTIYVRIPSGDYYIRNCSIGNYMQGQTAELYPFDGDTDQAWSITYIADGYFRIACSDGGNALTVPANYTNSADQQLQLQAYTGLDTQKWTITPSGDGRYVIRPKSGESYSTDWCVSAENSSSISTGHDVIQRAYTSDTNYLDEWQLYRVDSDIFLLGIDVPEHDHSSKLITSMNALYGMGYNGFNYTYTASISREAVLTQMSQCRIYLSRSHGNSAANGANLILGGGNVLHSSDIYDFSTNTAHVDLSNCELMLFVACQTANGDHCLPAAAVAAGARCAIGFEATIFCDSANVWVEAFFSKLAAGESIDKAVEAANEAAQITATVYRA